MYFCKPLFRPESVVLDGLDPSDVAVANDSTAVVTTHSTLVLIRDNQRISDLPVSYGPLCASMHPSKPEVAIGAKVGVYIDLSFELISLWMTRVSHLLCYCNSIWWCANYFLS